jgi:antitoxin FitA
MGNINIRNVDEATKIKFKTLAAAKGRSMEAELRDMIARAVANPPAPRNIGQSIMKRFDRLGGVELALPPRTRPRQNVKFDP